MGTKNKTLSIFTFDDFCGSFVLCAIIIKSIYWNTFFKKSNAYDVTILSVRLSVRVFEVDGKLPPFNMGS
jgi:hypothetical protein